MNTPILAIRGQYLDPNDLRFARNQREAGIEHLEWEERIRPLRPIAYDIALGLGVASAVAAVCVFG
jgi:hypothetical protein